MLLSFSVYLPAYTCLPAARNADSVHAKRFGPSAAGGVGAAGAALAGGKSDKEAVSEGTKRLKMVYLKRVIDSLKMEQVDCCQLCQRLRPSLLSCSTLAVIPHLTTARVLALQCLIFCRTNHDCDMLETFLNACGGARPGNNGRAFGGKVESN